MTAQNQENRSGLLPVRILLLGALMTVWIDWRVTETVTLWFAPEWFMPILAAWQSRRYGARSLLAWWPLALFPEVSIRIGPAAAGVGVSATTLLTSLVVAFAADRHSDPFEPDQWIRPGWTVVVQLAFCLLVIAGLENHSARLGDFSFTLTALPPVLVCIAALNPHAVFRINGLPFLAGRPLLERAVVACILAVLVGGIVVHFHANLATLSIRTGTTWISGLLPLLCFATVTLAHIRVRTIVLLLLIGVLADRLLSLGPESVRGLLGVEAEWRSLNWDLIFAGFGAAAAGAILTRYFRAGVNGLPPPLRMATTLFNILLLLVFGSLLTTMFPPSVYGATRWIFATIAFFAGAVWLGRGLIFAPLFMQALYLVAIVLSPNGSYHGWDLAGIGFIAFPFALCGYFSRNGRQLSPFMPTKSRPQHLPGPQIITSDISFTARVVEQVERSSTWRSFFVSAAPFLVLWQLVLIAVASLFTRYAAPQIDINLELQWWHFALGILLSLTPLSFVLWDWLDRRNSLRFLAFVSGSIVGAVAMMAIGYLLGMAIREIQGDLFENLQLLPLIGYFLVLLGSGLLADIKAARIVFRILSGIAALALLALLVQAGLHTDSETLLRTSALLAGILLTILFLIRFVRLRLILADDLPRELIFGELRDKGFWVRMAAVSGLPSSCWRSTALQKPAFWALFTARLIVYTGMALARTWAGIGLPLIVLGHVAFSLGKRLAAREIWRPNGNQDSEKHVLFLRGFDDDQCDFRRPLWNVYARWLDLWAFRRNADEAMIDEISQFGPVVALGRPSDKRIPFGALRHYSTDENWQKTLTEAARSAQAIVLVASDSPGVQWEYDLLKQENLLGKVLLLFRPGASNHEGNRRALAWYSAEAVEFFDRQAEPAQTPVAISTTPEGIVLMTSATPGAAAYVLALRRFFHRASA